MRPDLKMMLRGLGKFVAVALAAGLGGAAIGIGLAELTGSDAQTPTTTATTSAGAATTTGETQTQTQTTKTQATPARTTTTKTTTAPPRGSRLVPRVQILSAQLASGQVTVSVRVTNRFGRPLKIATPVLISDADEVRLDSAARDGAKALLKTLDPGASATGELRFTTPAAVAQRLSATPSARLKIAGRTVALKLKT